MRRLYLPACRARLICINRAAVVPASVAHAVLGDGGCPGSVYFHAPVGATHGGAGFESAKRDPMTDIANFLSDETGRVSEWSERARALFGYPAGEIVGRSAAVLYADCDEAAWRDLCRAAREQGGRDHAGACRHRDGRTLRAVTLLTPFGSGCSVVVRAEEAAVAASERLTRFDGIIQSAMDAIITVDESQTIVMFNAAAERIFGAPAGEALGTSLDRFMPERFRAAHRAHVHRFGTTGVTTRMMAGPVLYGLRMNGEEFPIDASISQTAGAGGRLYTVILRDATERVRAQEALERSYREFRELSAMTNEAREAERTRIARELHDELAQLLTALKMDVSWLSARLSPDQQNLIARGEKMKTLVDATVASVRRISADLRPVMLDDLGLLPSLENLLHSLSERAGVVVSLEGPREDFEFREPLATSIYRVVQEALTNVARHAHATEVRVSFSIDRGVLTVRVIDNGVGLPQTPPARKSYGLLGIRERAQTLGGAARFHRGASGGTTIEVTVPLARYIADEAESA